MRSRYIIGDAFTELRKLPDGCVHCCVSSPPYWGLRSYLDADAPKKAHEMGCEETPETYVENLVGVMHEVRRVLRDDGALWLNLGDSYASGEVGRHDHAQAAGLCAGETAAGRRRCGDGMGGRQQRKLRTGLKPKDLVGVPWKVAFALQADGWWLRSDIVWCLSGGTHIYARTQKGDAPTTIKDLARLDPSTVQLWNGHRWTQLLGMSRQPRNGTELVLVLRSGERIACTPEHRFATEYGIRVASELAAGDTLQRVQLPEPDRSKHPCHIDEDAAWFAGLYLAEGSRSANVLQLAGHVKESDRWERVRAVAAAYGGSATCTVDGNNMNIRVYGRLLVAIVDELVGGRTAKDKCFGPTVWHYDNAFLRAMLEGYLSGDGHWDAANGRWRLGFCRNYNLERDLRTICARLGFHLVLSPSTAAYQDGVRPSFRGEIRMGRSGHHNERRTEQIVRVEKARCRHVYDLGVEGPPHLFALASGILTHNSKPNPMPESVTDRPTKSHEYVFLLSKSERYYYDNDAIREPCQDHAGGPERFGAKGQLSAGQKHDEHGLARSRQVSRVPPSEGYHPAGRNIRTVWTIATHAYPEAHFATFPPELAQRCIMAGTSERGCCAVCGAPMVREVERHGYGTHTGQNKHDMSANAAGARNRRYMNLGGGQARRDIKTTGWSPSCSCAAPTEPCLVLDPFFGSGTVGEVCEALGRRWLGIELNPAYEPLIQKRTRQLGLFAGGNDA